jgi:eukaryotic-like serine/threonine-protein kinase
MFSTETGLGRYELLRELARNDAGAVYKAIVLDSQKTVAVRTIHPRPETSLKPELILQNASNALALKSPNVVLAQEVYEENGVVYVVMDYAEGVTLSSALGNLSEWELVDVTRQVGCAIDHATSRNISHCNLHPGNVIQEWDGTVKLLDHGITVNLLERARDQASVPDALCYLSPEQARGERPDHRSNLFSWGTILYEMVAGKKPFTADRAELVLEKILNFSPEPPHLTKRGIHPGVSRVIMKALAKSPAERYQTGADLVHALEHCKDESHAPARIEVPACQPSKPLASSPVVEKRAPQAAFTAAPSSHPSTPPAVPTNGTGPKVAVATAPESIVSAAKTVRGVANPNPATAPAAQRPLPAVEPTPASQFLIVDSSARTAAVPASPLPKANSQQAPFLQVNWPTWLLNLPGQLRALNLRSNPVLPYVLGTACLVLLAFFIGLFMHWHEQQPDAPAQVADAEQPSPPVSPELPAVAAPAPIVQDVPAANSQPVPSRKKKQKAPALLAAAPLPLTGALSIQSAPEGASIEIDGQSTAFLTPHTAAAIRAGSHTVRILKPGFEAQTRVINVEAGQTFPLNVSLSELRATVSITSEPPGAQISIDGKNTGRITPATVMLLKGRYAIGLQKQGFLQVTNTLEASPGQIYNVSPRLAPMGDVDGIKEIGKLKKIFGRGDSATRGKVQFRTTPRGAQVTVNGRVLKNLTPTEFLFPAGNYEILIALPGYKQVQKTISVVEGSTMTVDVPLER